MRRRTPLLAAPLLAALAAPATAQAHGLVGRADLPLPEEAFGAAAAGVLVVSFLALAGGWTSPRLEQARERRVLALPAAVDAFLGTLGVAVFAVAVYAGLAGTERATDNLLPTLVYVGFWVGIPFLSLLLGDVWRLLSPWRAIARAVAYPFRGGGSEPLPYPEKLGRWPAAATIVAFGICELAWAGAREPQTLAVLVLIYSAIQFVGMATYGIEPWSRNGDGFGLYFGFFARLSPWVRRHGALHARRPGQGVVEFDGTLPGTAALLIAAIGVTAFDGAREGPLFNDARPELQEFFTGLGLSLASALEATYTLCLFITIGVIALIWFAGVAGMPGRPGGRFVHSLIPIVAAYVVAHYFSLLAYNGQDLWRLAQDPLGNDPTGPDIDFGVVSATAIWYVQVIALVWGHVAALVFAHDRALVVYGDAKRATRSQIAMLVVMVIFTCLGLWLLSAANA